MAKKKLVHFRENLTFHHLFQPAYHHLLFGFPLCSKWGKEYFHNDHPIVLELGCGKGEYTIGLARRYPEKNFIGMDIKGARLWRGAKTVQEEHLKNIAFIRQRVDFIDRFFGPGEVSGIWITFPDPQKGKERKRMTSPGFLEKYRKVLSPGGIIHLKTDDIALFNYTLEVIGEHQHKVLLQTTDLYRSGITDEILSIRTYYEQMWLLQGKPICYLQFALR